MQELNHHRIHWFPQYQLCSGFLYVSPGKVGLHIPEYFTCISCNSHFIDNLERWVNCSFLFFVFNTWKVNAQQKSLLLLIVTYLLTLLVDSGQQWGPQLLLLLPNFQYKLLQFLIQGLIIFSCKIIKVGELEMWHLLQVLIFLHIFQNSLAASNLCMLPLICFQFLLLTACSAPDEE